MEELAAAAAPLKRARLGDSGLVATDASIAPALAERVVAQRELFSRLSATHAVRKSGGGGGGGADPLRVPYSTRVPAWIDVVPEAGSQAAAQLEAQATRIRVQTTPLLNASTGQLESASMPAFVDLMGAATLDAEIMWMSRLVSEIRRLSLVQSFIDLGGLDRLYTWLDDAVKRAHTQLLVYVLKAVAVTPGINKTLGHKIAPLVKKLSRPEEGHSRDVRETAMLVLRHWKASYTAATGAKAAPAAAVTDAAATPAKPRAAGGVASAAPAKAPSNKPTVAGAIKPSAPMPKKVPGASFASAFLGVAAAGPPAGAAPKKRTALTPGVRRRPATVALLNVRNPILFILSYFIFSCCFCSLSLSLRLRARPQLPCLRCRPRYRSLRRRTTWRR